MHILLAGSAGGHLAQLLTLRPWWQDHQRLWLTFDLPDARANLRDERVIWAHHSDRRQLFGLVQSARLAWRIVGSAHPDLVVSTGASLGALAILAARLRGIPTLYIEVFDRINLASVSGKIAYKVADEFAVQWEEQLLLYPKAKVIGPLL